MDDRGVCIAPSSTHTCTQQVLRPLSRIYLVRQTRVHTRKKHAQEMLAVLALAISANGFAMSSAPKRVGSTRVPKIHMDGGIHKGETFAEYMAKRGNNDMPMAANQPMAPAPLPATADTNVPAETRVQDDERTRDPAPSAYATNAASPLPTPQQAIEKAATFAEYMAIMSGKNPVGGDGLAQNAGAAAPAAIMWHSSDLDDVLQIEVSELGYTIRPSGAGAQVSIADAASKLVTKLGSRAADAATTAYLTTATEAAAAAAAVAASKAAVTAAGAAGTVAKTAAANLAPRRRRRDGPRGRRSRRKRRRRPAPPLPPVRPRLLLPPQGPPPPPLPVASPPLQLLTWPRRPPPTWLRRRLRVQFSPQRLLRPRLLLPRRRRQRASRSRLLPEPPPPPLPPPPALPPPLVPQSRLPRVRSRGRWCCPWTRRCRRHRRQRCHGSSRDRRGDRSGKRGEMPLPPSARQPPPLRAPRARRTPVPP